MLPGEHVPMLGSLERKSHVSRILNGSTPLVLAVCQDRIYGVPVVQCFFGGVTRTTKDKKVNASSNLYDTQNI